LALQVDPALPRSSGALRFGARPPRAAESLRPGERDGPRFECPVVAVASRARAQGQAAGQYRRGDLSEVEIAGIRPVGSWRLTIATPAPKKREPAPQFCTAAFAAPPEAWPDIPYVAEFAEDMPFQRLVRNE